mgnify:CR=1 FL=1
MPAGAGASRPGRSTNEAHAQAVITAFVDGTGKLSDVEAAVRRQAPATELRCSVGHTRAAWTRLVELHNSSFGENLFDKLLVNSTLCMPMHELVCVVL